ncbi:MAG: hypothetical protein AAFP98_03055 [Pseudomonadota bacterium]
MVLGLDGGLPVWCGALTSLAKHCGQESLEVVIYGDGKSDKVTALMAL